MDIESYIKENQWFKCNIEGIVYKCKITYDCSVHLSEPWLNVEVIKYKPKKFLFIFNIYEFYHVTYPTTDLSDFKRINNNRYFTVGKARELVSSNLFIRSYELKIKQEAKQRESNINIVKEI